MSFKINISTFIILTKKHFVKYGQINIGQKIVMKSLFYFILVVIRILIIINITYLLWCGWKYPDSLESTKLTWWVYYMVFDIWLDRMVNSPKDLD